MPGPELDFAKRIDAPPPQALAAELLPLIRRFARGNYGLALGGAHAKGISDAESDLDLYLFAAEIEPNEERARLCREFALSDAPVVSWGESAPFVQAGTDFYYRGVKVECWLRNTTYVSGILAECEQGIVRREFVTWTVTGFYNHCTLSDLQHMIPLEDPAGLLARWQAQVSVYPPRLREAILRTHLRAAHFWPDNFHYRSAIERLDVLYVTGIVQQTLHNLIQALFALNSAYFPGDKKLETALEQLPRTPARFAARLRALIFPAAEPTRELLRWQREELAALVREVDEIAAG